MESVDHSKSSDNEDSDSLSEDGTDFDIQFPMPKYQNMMNEFTNIDTFIISMDSLLVEIMLHDYLSWIYGGQSLVIVYMIETFLKSLDDKGGKFNLVWFNDLNFCFRENSSAFLMREIVKKHFSSIHSPQKMVFEFQSPFAVEWISYIEKLSPSFMFCSKGTLNQGLFPKFGCSQFAKCMKILHVFCFQARVAVVSFDEIEQNAATLFAYHSAPCVVRRKDILLCRKIWEESVHLVASADIKFSEAEMQHFCAIENVIDFWSVAVKLCFERHLEKQDVYATYCDMFLNVVRLQTSLPLDLRAQSLCNMEVLPESINDFVQNLCFSAATILHKMSEQCKFPVYDLIDGRLFAFVLISANADATSASKADDTSASTSSDCGQKVKISSMQPLKHRLFEVYATDLAKVINDSLSDNDQSRSRPLDEDHLFLELQHWHSGKLIEEDLKKDKDERKPSSDKKWIEKKKNRNKQKLATWYGQYGLSLEGNSQKAISFHPPEKNPIQKKEPQKMDSDSAKQKPQKKAEKIIADATQKRQKEKAAKEVQSILHAIQISQPIQNSDKFDTCEGKANALHYQIISLTNNVLDRSCEDLNKRRTNSVQLFLKIDEILHKECDDKKLLDVLKEEEKIYVWQVWQDLGFGQQSATPGINYHKLFLDMNAIDYRLAYAGESIEIQSDPLPDERVEGFIPDGWQRELLDAVDNNQSALIIAPTSAGKTFISYYCIEKVLREKSNGISNGIVVYVCPTKALANQVAATINARFKHKILPNGQVLFGVFNRDYRKDVSTARVLVTVPECLEILLLSPKFQNWRKKLKYAIFDEVHCIGGGIGDVLGSEVWEHIILLTPAPFLALSATVGNVKVLHQWLMEAEQSKAKQTARQVELVEQTARQVELVEHNERYSELELFLFNIFDPKSENKLFELNPLAVCNIQKIRQIGLPVDMQLTARQIYNLHDMIKCMKGDNEPMIKPSEFFKKNDFLLRLDLRNYEIVLKEQYVKQLMENNQEKVDLMNDLFKNVDLQLLKRSDPFDGHKLAKQGMVDLVLYMHNNMMLPCLCFSEDSTLCEAFAEMVTDYFEHEEKQFRNQENKQEHAQQKESKQKNKILKRHRDNKLEKVDDFDKLLHDEENDIRKTEDLEYSKFKLTKIGVDNDLYLKVIKRLKLKDGTLISTNLLLKCLKRGIGYHYSGMSTAQRQAVEILFRTGHLQIVFTTSTLALGIHMPCKSVVLAIDSPSLTPLQYRQMIGRAGRRGFDKSGNVIFYSIPTKKLTRLMTAGLPNLRANLPFTVSYILRLLALLASIDESELTESLKPIFALLQQPFIVHTLAHQRKALEVQLEHYFVFACLFLNKMRLIDSTMHPIGPAGIVTHLAYHDPGNFIFTYLLQRGRFHALCKKFSGVELDNQLVLIMSHLFTHTILPNAYKYQNIEQNKQGRISRVILGPLPPDFASWLSMYNEQVSQFYISFLNCLAENLFPVSEFEEKNCSTFVFLPFSRGIIPSPQICQSLREEPAVQNLLQSKLTLTKIGGPIFSMTGMVDLTFAKLNFLNLKLVYPLREGIYYDRRFVPVGLNDQRNHRGDRIALNAYALDFWKHESRKALLLENQIFDSDAFRLLNDFRLVLKSIRFALEELGPTNDDGSPNDIVVKAFSDLSEAYDCKFNRVWFQQNNLIAPTGKQ